MDSRPLLVARLLANLSSSGDFIGAARLASSQTTSRGLESTKGSSPHAEEPSPQEGGRRPLEVMEFYSTLPQTSLILSRT